MDRTGANGHHRYAGESSTHDLVIFFTKSIVPKAHTGWVPGRRWCNSAEYRARVRTPLVGRQSLPMPSVAVIRPQLTPDDSGVSIVTG